MKAILILAGSYSSCDATKIIWQNLCSSNNINFEVHDLSNDQGKDIALEHNIKSFPALLFNNKVVAVGHPDEQSAEKIIETLV